MKKSIILFLVFLIYTFFIITCPAITEWDKGLISFIQSKLSILPLWIPVLPDCILYTIMIIIPFLIFGIYFYKKRKYMDMVFLASIPLDAFILNIILKHLVHRVRPLQEFQLIIHPHSFSYVSSHSLVTACLWGLVIFYIIKYCKNNILKYLGITISTLWILFVGLSRVWIGVHYPTDVLGAYLLASCILLLYFHFINKGIKL